MTHQSNDPAIALVTSAYAVALEPDRFDDLLVAWDRWIAAGLGEAREDFAGIADAFDTAISTAARLETADELTHKSALEAAPSPAMLLDDGAKVIAANSATLSLLQAAAITPQEFCDSARRISTDTSDAARATYRLTIARSSRTFLAIETSVRRSIQALYPDATRMLLISLIDWSESFGDELKALLNLSEAELRVARGLLEGRTAQEISSDLSRSLPTVRSHIKTLLKKTGARRQTELVQILTILRQLSDLPSESLNSVDCDTVRERVLPGLGSGLRIAEYGAGEPLLYFATSSLPGETAAVRDAFAGAEFYVCAPYRPPPEARRRTSQSASDALLEDWLQALVAHLGDVPLLVGHREGGVLALKAADKLLREGANVPGVVLISTGAPVAALSEFRAAGPSVYRTFLAAHTAPVALRLGYRTAARVFGASRAGQDRIMRYFFQDSPVDAALLNDPAMADVVRANLTHCFEDTSQVVADVRDWTSDWSDLLAQVASRIPVSFVHGTAHPFLGISAVSECVETSRNMTLHRVEGAAQMALYTAPAQVEAACRALLTAGPDG